MKKSIQLIIKNLLFFWTTLIVYRLIKQNIHFSDSAIQYAISGSILIVLISFCRIINVKFLIFSGILICWIICSGIYPQITDYLFGIIVTYLILGIYIHRWDAAIIALVFILNLAVGSYLFMNEIKESPQNIVFNSDSYRILSTKVKLEKIDCNESAFLNKLERVSQKNNINPAHVLFVMWMESRIYIGAINQSSDARGLWQFIPSTSRNLGINHKEIIYQNGLKQLDYIDKYLSMFKKQIKYCDDVYKLYLIVFYPAAVMSANDSYVFPVNVRKANPKVFETGNNYKGFKDYVDRQMFLAGIGF